MIALLPLSAEHLSYPHGEERNAHLEPIRPRDRGLLRMRRAQSEPGAVGADYADVLSWQDVNARSPIPLRHSPGFVMRSVLSATLMIAAAGLAAPDARAQLAPPSTAGAK